MPHFECGAFNHSATSPAWGRKLVETSCLGPRRGQGRDIAGNDVAGKPEN